MVLAVALLACAGSLARAAEPDAPRRERVTADRSIPASEVPGRLSQRGYAVTDPVIRRGSAYLTHGTDKFRPATAAGDGRPQRRDHRPARARRRPAPRRDGPARP